MASKVKQSRKGRKRSSKNEVVEPAIQSENSEDVTYSEELTSTQQKYVPVFGKPSKSTQKSQPDGNVENTAKRPRKENSQLEEDPKLGSVIEEEEVSEMAKITSEYPSMKELDSDMKNKDASQGGEVMKESNQSSVTEESVGDNVCMIEVERCELNHQEKDQQERVCHVAEGPDNKKEEEKSIEVTIERDNEEPHLGSLAHPIQDAISINASCSDFENSIKPGTELPPSIEQNSKMDTEVLEADSCWEDTQRGSTNILPVTVGCQKEGRMTVNVDSSCERILKEVKPEKKEAPFTITQSDIQTEEEQEEDTCKLVYQAKEPTDGSINVSMDNLKKLDSLTIENSKTTKGIEDNVSQDFKIVTEMSKILYDAISGTKISGTAAVTKLEDDLREINIQAVTKDIVLRNQKESAQNVNSGEIDQQKVEKESEIVVAPLKKEIPPKVSRDLSKEDENDMKNKGEKQLTDLVKFDDIECDKNDIWTDSQMDMLDEIIPTTSARPVADTDMLAAVDLPILAPQKTIDEYSNEGTLLMKGLIDELSSVTKNIVSMKRYIDSVKKQRQSRINVIWKNDKGNKN